MYDDLDFSKSPFWVQIYGLAPNQINKENARMIGNRVEEFVEDDLNLDGLWATPYFLDYTLI